MLLCAAALIRESPFFPSEIYGCEVRRCVCVFVRVCVCVPVVSRETFQRYGLSVGVK